MMSAAECVHNVQADASATEQQVQDQQRRVKKDAADVAAQAVEVAAASKQYEAQVAQLRQDKAAWQAGDAARQETLVEHKHMQERLEQLQVWHMLQLIHAALLHWQYYAHA